MTLSCCLAVQSGNVLVGLPRAMLKSALSRGLVMDPGKKFVFTVFVSMLMTGVLPAFAGIWDDPENLKVLPKDISPDELGATMRGFAMGTGSRCSVCHVGEVEADLDTYDFSLDDKEMKLKAREMIHLVRSVNEKLALAFPDAKDPLVEVTCATCHRGQAKPVMIEDVLAQALHDDGLDKAVADYRDLRNRYYGGYTYDFSERSLMRFAEQLASEEALDDAIGFLDLNLEFYPQSSRSYSLRGQVYAELGDIAAAREDYVKALEIEPQSGWIRGLLEALDQG
jgi:tetratricopeptide (TPR) repeat protein